VLFSETAIQSIYTETTVYPEVLCTSIAAVLVGGFRKFYLVILTSEKQGTAVPLVDKQKKHIPWHLLKDCSLVFRMTSHISDLIDPPDCNSA
jgi:hypothetical protein